MVVQPGRPRRNLSADNPYPPKAIAPVEPLPYRRRRRGNPFQFNYSKEMRRQRLKRFGRGLALAIGLPGLLAACIWFLAAAADRLIPARHGTTVVVMERFHDHERRVPDTYGVWVRRGSGDRQHVHSDVLYDDFGESGLHDAEASGWFNQIVSVTIDGRKIEVGQSLRFQLFWVSRSWGV